MGAAVDCRQPSRGLDRSQVRALAATAKPSFLRDAVTDPLAIGVGDHRARTIGQPDQGAFGGYAPEPTEQRLLAARRSFRIDKGLQGSGKPKIARTPEEPAVELVVHVEWKLLELDPDLPLELARGNGPDRDAQEHHEGRDKEAGAGSAMVIDSRTVAPGLTHLHSGGCAVVIYQLSIIDRGDPGSEGRSGMAALLVGDDIVTADDPVRVLVVDGPEGVRFVQGALREYHDLLKVDACHELQSGLEEARTGMHDVILLALQLPDAWPADAYGRFRQEIDDRPILVMANSHDASVAARKVSTPPFCVIERQERDSARLRRLIVSAVLFKRAGGSRSPARWRTLLQAEAFAAAARTQCAPKSGGERKSKP